MRQRVTPVHGIPALLQVGLQAVGNTDIVFDYQDSHGGIVTFNSLLRTCCAVWYRAAGRSQLSTPRKEVL